MAEIFLWSRSDSQGAPSAETRHSDSARKAPDTREEHGLLHRKDKKKKIFSTNSYFKTNSCTPKQTKAGGWQAMGNGRTEQGASILITVTHRHTLHTFKTFFGHYFFSNTTPGS